MSNIDFSYFIPDADLRCGLDGLSKMLYEQHKVRAADLRPGQFAIFVNHSWTMVRALGVEGKVYLHYREPDGARLNPKAVLRLPRFIRGQDIGYKQALTEVIEAEYTTRYPIASKREAEH